MISLAPKYRGGGLAEERARGGEGVRNGVLVKGKGSERLESAAQLASKDPAT